jgi:GT2 family glycosyltransferase
MSLAFVLPVLNCLAYTRQAIASIQFGAGDQLFVIDNGSTDGTPAEMQTYLDAKLPLVYVRHERNTGVAAAWNQGLKFAFQFGHDPVLVMNNDVVLAHDTVPALLRWHEKTGGIISAHSVAALHALDLVDRREIYQEPCDYSCFLISKSIVDRVGWFDEAYFPAYFEDMDYDCRAEMAGIPRGHAGDAVVCHFQSRTLHEGHIENHERHFEANRRRFLARWERYILGGRNARSV